MSNSRLCLKGKLVSANERDLIVGGQAVIEGVMMRTPNAYSVAVRRADGTITHTGARLAKWSDRVPLLKLPVLRGGAVLVQSMALGIKALNYSAGEAYTDAEATEEVEVVLSPAVIAGEGDFAGITGATPGLIPVPTRKRPEEEMKRGTMAAFGSIAFALLFNVFLFIIAPLILTNAIFIGAGWAVPAGGAVETSAAQTQTAQTASNTERRATPQRMRQRRVCRGTRARGMGCAAICAPCARRSLSTWLTARFA